MEIMFDDLTSEAQERLLEEVGVSSPEEMYWDTDPIAIVKFENDESSGDDFTEDFFNYDCGEDGL